MPYPSSGWFVGPRVFFITEWLKAAHSGSLRPLSLVSTSLISLDLAVRSTNVSPVCLCILPNSAFQSPCTNRMPFFGVWSMVFCNCWWKCSTSLSSCPFVGASTCMTVMLKGAAVKQIEISLLETGQHPKTALTMSLCIRNPIPYSCLSASPLK